MARIVFRLNQSLDGYVDHQKFERDPGLFRHFTEQVRGVAGSIYGRKMYEAMRYWDEDRSDWGAEEREYAAVWRRQPKWVVSRSLTSVGPNATLVATDVEAVIGELKARVAGELQIGGPEVTESLAGLVDEYQFYIHPLILGGGKPIFASPLPVLRFVASDRVGENTIRLTYVRA
ncbi:MAG TPA: dihydrofolate reductase family protein [Devosiaceae bacterium]|jgi:dihydrofolate reductase